MDPRQDEVIEVNLNTDSLTPLWKGEVWKQTHTKNGTHWRLELRCQQQRSVWASQKLWRGNERSFPTWSRQSLALPTPWFQISNLQNYQTRNLDGSRTTQFVLLVTTVLMNQFKWHGHPSPTPKRAALIPKGFWEVVEKPAVSIGFLASAKLIFKNQGLISACCVIIIMTVLFMYCHPQLPLCHYFKSLHRKKKCCACKILNGIGKQFKRERSTCT